MVYPNGVTLILKEDIKVSEEIGVMLASSFDDKEFEDLTVEQIADGPVEYSLWNRRDRCGLGH